MTRKEFLKQAAKQVNFQNLEDTRENALNRIRNRFGITADVDFLLDFLYENGFKGCVGFSRYEKRSNDKLYITIGCIPRTICFWEDIGQYVSVIVYINGCTFNYSCVRHIESFYLSEDGRFWDENHKLRFETEEELFDYLLTVEYDFHPVITERTYEMLRHFGWYEGRRIDTTDFERELKKYGITLSQIQLDAISEFSGLEFSFSQSSRNQEFFSLERIVKMMPRNNSGFNTSYFQPEVYDYHDANILVGRNVLVIGSDDYDYFSISDDGKIFTARGNKPVGRTTLEYIYAFGADLDENVKWL